MEEADCLDIQALDGIPIPVDENNLVYQSVKYIYDLCGKPMKGMKIRQTNKIPMARGLGSSSACIVGLSLIHIYKAQAYPAQLSGGQKQRVAIARAVSYTHLQR